MRAFLLCTLLAVVQATYVPVYVMLPLDTITSKGLTNPSELQQRLQTLKSVNTDGITVDVWWGLVETTAQTYDWSAYSQLFKLISDAGLKIQPIMDFHTCGGNVGDTCDIQLPSWVLSVGASDPDIWYTDSQGHRDNEYISLFVDNESLFGGRTPVQIYQQFIQSFATQFSGYLGSTITQVEIGMGPAGEMRYPSYQLKYWNFCGVGEFQSYSKYALASVAKAAQNAGQPLWGLAGGPNNAGTYSDYYVPFFTDNTNSNYQSAYGQFFLSWYSQQLLDHGERILSAVSPIFQNTGASICGKVAGIHWWYRTNSHAAECTAGYYNTNQNNAYLAISNMFAKYGAGIDFTCLEMVDSQQPAQCDCGPAELVQQVKAATQQAGIKFGGENALPRYDNAAYAQIETQASYLGYPLDSFSYLRLTKDLLNQPNLGNFQIFVNQMHALAMNVVYQPYGSLESSSTDAAAASSAPKSSSFAVAVGCGVAALVVVAAAVAFIAVRRVRLARRDPLNVPLTSL